MVAIGRAGVSVREARDRYLAQNGFSVEAYSAPYATMNVFGVRFRIPNAAGRKKNIRFHDLHHVLTGFGTDVAGEGEIAAWQYRAGLPRSWFVRVLITCGLLLGFVVAPRRVLRAWRAGRGCRSLFIEDGRPTYDELLDLELGELRARVGLPRDGVGRAG